VIASTLKMVLAAQSLPICQSPDVRAAKYR